MAVMQQKIFKILGWSSPPPPPPGNGISALRPQGDGH